MVAITSLPTNELEDFFRLLPQIFCDYRTHSKPFGLVYLYSQTRDNADSMFLRAIELANAMHALGVGEGSLGHGYDGYDASVARLRELGWDDRIPIRKLDVKGNVNTLSEAHCLVDNYQLFHLDVGIVAPPFHLPRAFMTSVSVLNGRPMHVYAIPGVECSWSEEVVHSQGIVRDTRAGLLDSELKRLEKYRAEEFGSLYGAGDVLRYLGWRNSHSA